jgi:ATP-binding cassette, subfamily C, bacterial LapB
LDLNPVEIKKPLGRDDGWLEGFHWALEHLAREQGVMLEPLELQALGKSLRVRSGVDALRDAATHLGLSAPARLTLPDRARLPVLAYLGDEGWGVVMGCEPDGSWLVATSTGSRTLTKSSLLDRCYEIQMTRIDGSRSKKSSVSGFSDLLAIAWRPFRGSLFEAGLATVFMGVLALATSLFSMQVYDRVIPTGAVATLVVLSMGVLLCILIELATKFARSHIMDHVTVGLDSRLSREIFQRLLFLRVDQMPASVGSLAGQLRGYEQVRSFYTASTLFTLVDVPVALAFLAIIMLIASPLVAVVPFATACLAFIIGLLSRRKINQLAAEGARYSNQKTGLLVEAVEGVETIKSGSGGWKFLRRWIELNAITVINDLKMRKSSEGVSYLAATLQQVSYAGVVISGSLVVMNGDMTMGALIACSILSGRILAPIMALPGLMVQHAHARAAIDGLDKLYQLKTDNHEVDQPLIPSHLQGAFELEGVSFSYEQQAPGLQVPTLLIQAGERVGILGAIGSGKSTLLRLLSGMYVPTEGRVLLDGLDLSHISRDVINRHVGYLQQEHRLFQGTLRENLLIGLHDPGDAVLMKVMVQTGMDRLVRSHPKGLERMIAEGGKGLSGGQRQLLAFTRLLLSENSILLLDEPTANMDQEQEVRCLSVLSNMSSQGKTLVVVTHKPSLLPLVDRLVVVANNRIVLDGPKEAVLNKLAGVNKTNRPVIAPQASQKAVA